MGGKASTSAKDHPATTTTNAKDAVDLLVSVIDEDLKNIVNQFKETLEQTLSKSQISLPGDSTVINNSEEEQEPGDLSRYHRDSYAILLQRLQKMCRHIHQNKPQTMCQLELLLHGISAKHKTYDVVMKKATFLTEHYMLQIPDVLEEKLDLPGFGILAERLARDAFETILNFARERTGQAGEEEKSLIEKSLKQALDLSHVLENELATAYPHHKDYFKVGFDKVKSELKTARKTTLEVLDEFVEFKALKDFERQSTSLFQHLTTEESRVDHTRVHEKSILDLSITESTKNGASNYYDLSNKDGDSSSTDSAIFESREKANRKFQFLYRETRRHGMIQRESQTFESSGRNDIENITLNPFPVSHQEAQRLLENDPTSDPAPGTHTFKYPISNFHSLLNSGKKVTSLDYRFPQIDSYFRGTVWFLRNGELDIRLSHVCYRGATLSRQKITYKANVAGSNSFAVSRYSTKKPTITNGGWESEIKLGRRTVPSLDDLNSTVVIVYSIEWETIEDTSSSGL